MNTPAVHLHKEYTGLRNLVWLQRAFRLGLRAAWFALGAFLTCWALRQMVPGFPENPQIWLAASCAAALPWLITAILRRPRLEPLLWNIDRRMGTHEQLTTALNAARQEHPSMLEDALMTDVLKLFPNIRARILRHGWDFLRDLSALVLILVLALVCEFTAGMNPVELASTSAFAEPLPAAFVEPGYADLFPIESACSEDQMAANQNASGAQNPSPISAEQLAALGENLQSLGDQLGNQAATEELGYAIKDMDPQKAADALEKLADNLDNLSPENQDEVADNLQQASNSLSSTPMQSVGSSLGDAASAMQGESPNLSAAKNALDQAASQMRALDSAVNQQGSSSATGEGSGTGSQDAIASEPQSGEGEDFSRIAGGAEENFQISGDSPSGLTSPGKPQGDGDGTAISKPRPQPSSAVDSSTGSTVLTPYSYSWMWRNVVSRYFKAR